MGGFTFTDFEYAVASLNGNSAAVLFTGVATDGGRASIPVSARDNDASDIFFSLTYFSA